MTNCESSWKGKGRGGEGKRVMKGNHSKIHCILYEVT
jgi:hypothetical protein